MQKNAIPKTTSTWQQIFDDLKGNPESFKRYYPMVRIAIDHHTIHDFIRAYVTNNDFYELCQMLVSEEGCHTEEK